MAQDTFQNQVATVPAELDALLEPVTQGVDALLAFFDEDEEAPPPAPQFSMEQHLRQEVRFTGSSSLAEVFWLQHSGVRACQAVHVGNSLPLGSGRVEHVANGLLRLHGVQEWNPSVRRNNELLPASSFTSDDGTLLLRMGDSATLHTPQGDCLVRLSPAPATLREVMQSALHRAVIDQRNPSLAAWSIGVSITSHLLMMLGAWVLDLRNPTMVIREIDDVWACPTPPPLPVIDDVVPPAPVPPTTQAPPEAKSAPRKRQVIPQQKVVQQAGGASSVLAPLDKILGKLNSKNKAVMAATSNIPGVRSRDNGFKTIGFKAPGPTIDMNFGRTDGVTPKGMNYYAKHGDVGSLAGHEKGEIRPGKPRVLERTPGNGPQAPALSSEAIAKVVQQHMGEIQHCYEVALFNNPGLAGRARLEWTVGASGDVSLVRSMVSDVAAATPCMMERIKTWKFPALPSAKTVVTYPFVFRPAHF